MQLFNYFFGLSFILFLTCCNPKIYQTTTLKDTVQIRDSTFTKIILRDSTILRWDTAKHVITRVTYKQVVDTTHNLITQEYTTHNLQYAQKKQKTTAEQKKKNSGGLINTIEIFLITAFGAALLLLLLRK